MNTYYIVAINHLTCQEFDLCEDKAGNPFFNNDEESINVIIFENEKDLLEFFDLNINQNNTIIFSMVEESVYDVLAIEFNEREQQRKVLKKAVINTL